MTYSTVTREEIRDKRKERGFGKVNFLQKMS
jgi:hypothetical protein